MSAAWRGGGRRLPWLLALTLVACASPGDHPPPTPLAPLTPAAAGLAADAATTFPVSDWWRVLGDPALDALVAQGLAGQPSLQAAAARLVRAGAGLDAVQATQGLQADGMADATRQRFSGHGLIPPAVAGRVRNTASLQVHVHLPLDFFGRHQAALQAALGQQRAAAADLQAARVGLAATLAQGWVQLAQLLAQRDLLLQTEAQRQAVRNLTAQRVAAGLDTQGQLRSADGPLPDVRGQRAALDGQIALARHQLALLSGQAPHALAGAAPSLARLQVAALPTRIGADLLGRRADVVAARWRVESAAQGVAAARADFYPDINLSGFFGLNALGLDRLLSLGSRQFGGGPAVRLPLFDGGALRAQLQGRSAEADAAVAAYNGVVLDAAREAADAGSQLQSLALQQAEQAQAQAAADDAQRLAQQRFDAGLGNRLPALQLQTAVLAQQAAAAELKARQLVAQVALARALGGGWQDEPAPASAAGTPVPTR